MAINRRGDRYIVDWWTEGKRYRKFFDRQHDARDFAAKVRNDKRTGSHVAPDRIPLFHEAARDWLTSRSDRAAGTFSQYETDVRIHLNPTFGNYRLNQISTEAITAWRLALTQTAGHSRWRRPLLASTISRITTTLSSIFDAAVRTKRLSVNPCEALERAYVRQKQGKRQDGKVRPDEILNADEIRRLIDAAKPGLERTIIVLAAATGVRSGELLALRWTDVTLTG
jgi:integrase